MKGLGAFIILKYGYLLLCLTFKHFVALLGQIRGYVILDMRLHGQREGVKSKEAYYFRYIS